jgi:EmrB/QacA subfamily drug resistance transporter
MKNMLFTLWLRRRLHLKIPCLRTGITTQSPLGESRLDGRATLTGLTVPFFMVILNAFMFAVALPAVRSSFDAQADLVAWMTTGYTLSFVIFMPLYGRLGDAFGKRSLFLAGTLVFLLGTCIIVLAPDLRLLLVGRVIQGAGAAGVTPLALAMISELFPARQRGKVLGTWNSMGPVAGMVGPLLAGLLIDNWGWRSVFGPTLIVGLVAAFVAPRCIPALRGNARPGFLHGFDWGGVVLMGAGVTTLLFYVSSRLITGVPALRDWRLLAGASLLMVSFAIWEKRRPNPFISLDIFAHRPFAQASFCSGVRMFVMSGIIFLLPLYLADVQALSAAWIGFALVVHAGALFVTMRLGGQLADRWGSRRPVVLGICVQTGVMICFALLSGTASLVPVIIGVTAHGLGGGLALPALHRAAMEQVPQAQMGVAAGLYSMIRFGGMMLGTTLEGVLLQQGLDRGLPAAEVYQMVYGLIAGVGLLGVIVGLTLREKAEN